MRRGPPRARRTRPCCRSRAPCGSCRPGEGGRGRRFDGARARTTDSAVRGAKRNGWTAWCVVQARQWPRATAGQLGAAGKGGTRPCRFAAVLGQWAHSGDMYTNVPTRDLAPLRESYLEYLQGREAGGGVLWFEGCGWVVGVQRTPKRHAEWKRDWRARGGGRTQSRRAGSAAGCRACSPAACC